MTRVVLWGLLTAFFATLVESSILSRLAFLPAMPDMVLLIVLWVSIENGSAVGCTTGFLSGLVLDFLSAAPVGLNALTKSVLGYVSGRFSGSFNMNRIALPVTVAVVGTALKALLTFGCSLFFGARIVVYDLGATDFWYELVMNALFAPPVFAFLSLFPGLFGSRIAEGE